MDGKPEDSRLARAMDLEDLLPSQRCLRAHLRATSPEITSMAGLNADLIQSSDPVNNFEVLW